MSWWEKQPLLISAVQCNYGKDEKERAKISEQILNEYTIGYGFNTEQLFHLAASYAKGHYTDEKEALKLDEYLKKTRAAGLRVIVYINIHCMDEMYSEHPDWAQRDASGNPLMAYDVFPYICLRSGYREYIKESFANLCRRDIDGIFLDGPVMLECHCPACDKEFKETYGKPISEATYIEHMNFNIDGVADFMREIHDTVKSINPNILLYLNNSALRADVTGSNTRKLEPYVDLLGAEGGFVWVNKETPLWHVSPMAKMIETQAKGKPTVIFIAGDYKPWSFCMHTYHETKIYYAQSLANGANVWYGIHGPIEQMNTGGGRAAIEMNAFINEHKDIFSGSEAQSKVALMWSQDSANYYSSSVRKTDFTDARHAGTQQEVSSDHYAAFMGYYEALMRNHIQHGLIDEESILDGELSNYDLLILPTCACMRDEVADKIREFVANGGNLISEFDTGFYNQYGTRADSPKLADVQGIKVKGFVTYPAGVGSGYQWVTNECPVTAGLSWKHTAAPTLATNVEPLAGAVVNAEYCVPMKSRYVDIPKDSFPSIISNTYGKGKSVYFTGALGEFYSNNTNPDHKRMIKNAVCDMADPLVETNAPGSVEVVLRRQNNRYFLHVINITGEMERPIDRLIPIKDVDFRLNLDTEVSSVKTVSGKSAANIKKTENGMEFTLPEITDYEIVIIE